MKITTADCKAFLADYFTKTQVPLLERWREVQPDVWAAVVEAKNWKRMHKVKSGAASAYMGPFDKYEVHNAVGVYTVRPATDFVVERGFVCAEAEFESEIQFLVLEDAEGRLYLGTDVSD